MIRKQSGKIRNFTKKFALISACALSVFIFNGQEANAQETNVEEKINPETVVKDEGTVEFLDENGNVMAIYTPYSETNPAPSIQPRYSGSVDWTVGWGWYSGSSRFELNSNNKIDLNISISPSASSNIGLYDVNNHTYGWPSDGGSSTGWYGTIQPGYTGNFSIAIANNTEKTVHYDGTFTVR